MSQLQHHHVHQRASLVAQRLLGEDAADQVAVLDDHLEGGGGGGGGGNIAYVRTCIIYNRFTLCTYIMFILYTYNVQHK